MLELDVEREIAAAEATVDIIGVLPLALHSQAVPEAVLAALKTKQGLAVRLLCEADSDLFHRSLSTDTHYAAERVGFGELRFRRNRIGELGREWARAADQLPEKQKAKELARLQVQYVHVPITMYVARFDAERLFALPVTQRIPAQSEYTLLPHGQPQRQVVEEYLDHYLDPARGGRFTASPDAETLELYDHESAPRGIYPRASFYGTDYHQYVVWVFILDRGGRLLIHQRAENARDNRGMWDKSVGGHVDWRRELSSDRTAVRETIEELFEDELNKEAMAWFTENKENVIYLGDWRPDKRGFGPLDEVGRFGREWGYFRLPTRAQVESPRYLPNGEVRNLRVLADMYAFIANDRLCPENLDELRNSRFRLVRLSDLKSEVERGVYTDSAGKEHPFNATPDLRHIMGGQIRETLEEVSEHIRYAFRDKGR